MVYINKYIFNIMPIKCLHKQKLFGVFSNF